MGTPLARAKKQKAGKDGNCLRALGQSVSEDARRALQKFIAENRSAMADDVDGDPGFLATSAFMMRRAAELSPALTFRDIKDVRAEKMAA